MHFFAQRVSIPVFTEVATAKPTAELRPLEEGAITQLDEDEMGMTYEELDEYGRLRQIDRAGPFTMFMTLLEKWHSRIDSKTGKPLTPEAVATKVKHFFR